MKQNQSTAKSRGWMVTLGATASLAAYVLCVFLPGHKSIASLRRQLAEKQQAVMLANSQAASLAQLENQLQRARHYVDQWKQSSPTDPNLVELLGKISSLAGQTGVRVSRLSPHETVAMAALKQHPVALELEGEFHQLVDFLGRLEELPETVWIRRLHMKRSSENGMAVQCGLMLSVFADNRDVSG